MFVLITIGVVIVSSKNAKVAIAPTHDEQQTTIQSTQPIGMCYYYSKATTSEYVDRAWVKMSIIGTNVKGEYRNLPADKDKMTGVFEGSIGVTNKMTTSRTARVWWMALAEGMTTKQELHINFGQGSAAALFGEMVNRGDGVYVYKDQTKLTPGITMPQIDCGQLVKILTVEEYVRSAIGTLSIIKPTLGGAWYVTTIDTNPNADTGMVVYEDGHVKSKATFTYLFNKDTYAVAIKNFKISK